MGASGSKKSEFPEFEKEKKKKGKGGGGPQVSVRTRSFLRLKRKSDVVVPKSVHVDELPHAYVITMEIPPEIDPKNVRVTPVKVVGTILDATRIETTVDDGIVTITVPRVIPEKPFSPS